MLKNTLKLSFSETLQYHPLEEASNMADPAIIEEVQQVSDDERIQEVADEELCTRDRSVDWKGRPAIKGTTGGWRVAIILLVNQALVTMALFGVGVNLVMFMTGVLQQDNAEAANNISDWTGTTYVFSLVGAFLSDSYWGRYKTCTVFQLIFVSGLIELSVSSYLLLRKSCAPGDGTRNCEPPSNLVIAVFYLAIYQIALGNGAYQPTATTFGADQFDENDRQEGESKITFFSYFYLANNIGTIFSNSYLAYLENKGKWVLAFGISAGTAFLALVLFIIGTPRFRHFKPGGNPLSRFSQVIIAALKKRKVTVPPHGDELYEVHGKQSAINGGRKILHSPDFKFLDRAAVITTMDLPPQNQINPPNPWSLCTVTQVEEVKCILRLLPIWLSSIIYSVVFTQMNSVFVEQGNAMKTSISKFNIPAASMSIFEILGVASFVLLNRLYLLHFSYRQKKGNPKKITELYRMGIGLIIAGISMVVAGIVESQRLKYAHNDCDGDSVSSSLSILWQIPQYTLIGASEVFMYVTQIEFFNDQAPDGLKSFGSALYMASVSFGNYVSSLIIAVVMEITTKGGRAGWLSDNLNQGHLDRFYYLQAALSAINFLVYVACAKGYRYILLEDKSESGDNVVRTEN